MRLGRSIEHRMAEANLLIGDAERAVAHQMIEVERMRAEGYDTTKAEKLLRAFQHTLEALQEDRQMLISKSIGLN